MSKKKIILTHLLIFIFLTIILFFSAERILQIFASDFHNVGMWIELIIKGTIGILIILSISCFTFLAIKPKPIEYKRLSQYLYGISLFTPMFIGSWIIGIKGLILGWMGFFYNFEFIFIPWLANLIYFLNLLINKNIKLKIILSILTISFSLLTIGLSEIPENEGGNNEKVMIGIGFLIWITSFITLLIGQIKEYRDK